MQLAHSTPMPEKGQSESYISKFEGPDPEVGRLLEQNGPEICPGRAGMKSAGQPGDPKLASQGHLFRHFPNGLWPMALHGPPVRKSSQSDWGTQRTIFQPEKATPRDNSADDGFSNGILPCKEILHEGGKGA